MNNKKLAFLAVTATVATLLYTLMSDKHDNNAASLQAPPTTQSDSHSDPGTTTEFPSTAKNIGSALQEEPRSFEVHEWGNVDLNTIREELPDNLYWELAAPTDDPLILEQREEMKAFWAREQGKIMAGTAMEPEIHAYYAYRQQVSQDYVDFANHMINNYSNDLPTRDVRLLNLTRNLHSGRLSEIPAHQNEALKRSQQHEANREAWLQDKEAYTQKLKEQAEQANRAAKITQ